VTLLNSAMVFFSPLNLMNRQKAENQMVSKKVQVQGAQISAA
jgi:hypothetical protein